MLERRDKNLTDLERRVSNTVLIGKVSQVDHAKARYRVKAGEFESDWLPFTSARAGNTRTY
ncbi:MAG: phage baseplate assembly protein V, partial [Mesorhizobium sp.]